MKKHSQLKWLASLALGAGVLAAYGIHDAQAAYAALPADGTAGVVEQKEAQPLRWFTEKADAVGSSTPYGNNEKAGHYVQSGDARLYYEVYGKGTPVVVLHGGGVGTPYEMGCIIDELRKNHEVIVMSTRGHGRSEIGHSPLTYKQKGEDVLAVMDAAHVKKAMIVGFSDGAYSAYETAVLAPERVERIAAIGAGTLRKGYFSADIDVEALEKVDPAFFAQQKKLMPEPERWGSFMKDYMKFWNGMEVGKETFGKIECPVLLIAGDEDDHAPMVTMVEAADLLKNGRLLIVPKAWHTAFLDNFPVVWAGIEPFLDAKESDLLPSKKVAYNDKILESRNLGDNH